MRLGPLMGSDHGLKSFHPESEALPMSASASAEAFIFFHVSQGRGVSVSKSNLQPTGPHPLVQRAYIASDGIRRVPYIDRQPLFPIAPSQPARGAISRVSSLAFGHRLGRGRGQRQAQLSFALGSTPVRTLQGSRRYQTLAYLALSRCRLASPPKAP